MLFPPGEENKEMIALCKEEMETLTSQTPEQYVRNANAAISKCPEIIEAEKMGDYDKDNTVRACL